MCLSCQNEVGMDIGGRSSSLAGQSNGKAKQVKAIAGDTEEGVLVSEQSMVSSTEMKTSRKSVHVS